MQKCSFVFFYLPLSRTHVAGPVQSAQMICAYASLVLKSEATCASLVLDASDLTTRSFVPVAASLWRRQSCSFESGMCPLWSFIQVRLIRGAVAAYSVLRLVLSLITILFRDIQTFRALK